MTNFQFDFMAIFIYLSKEEVLKYWGLGFGVWGLGFGVWEIGRAHV